MNGLYEWCPKHGFGDAFEPYPTGETHFCAKDGKPLHHEPKPRPILPKDAPLYCGTCMIEVQATAGETKGPPDKETVDLLCPRGHTAARLRHAPPHGWALDPTFYGEQTGEFGSR